MAKKFNHLTVHQARELGSGNVQGWTDYVRNQSRRYDEEPEEGDLFVRGYLAGYRLASRGRRPFLMGLKLN